VLRLLPSPDLAAAPPASAAAAPPVSPPLANAAPRPAGSPACTAARQQPATAQGGGSGRATPLSAAAGRPRGRLTAKLAGAHRSRPSPWNGADTPAIALDSVSCCSCRYSALGPHAALLPPGAVPATCAAGQSFQMQCEAPDLGFQFQARLEVSAGGSGGGFACGSDGSGASGPHSGGGGGGCWLIDVDGWLLPKAVTDIEGLERVSIVLAVRSGLAWIVPQRGGVAPKPLSVSAAACAAVGTGPPLESSCGASRRELLSAAAAAVIACQDFKSLRSEHSLQVPLSAH